jgi:hypothetical protein
MSTPDGDADAGPTVPWICEECGHFVVLPEGRSETTHRCPTTDGAHRLVPYTGAMQAFEIRNEMVRRDDQR